jgi:tRNA (cytidine/uridine-2'-O-)-methyltransferase
MRMPGAHSGMAEAVHTAAEVRLKVPLQPGTRSLNVAMACAMAVGEAAPQAGRVANGE